MFAFDFRAFLAGEGSYVPGDDDFDYEYQPRGQRHRKDYLIDEITCLEETLAKRRAELREADELLYECHEDLKDARAEVGCHKCIYQKVLLLCGLGPDMG